MTIDEAIAHCEEVAGGCSGTECEADHRQLAEWLKELKERREHIADVGKKDTISRQAAIDALHGYFDGMLETDTVCPADIYGLFECIPSAQPNLQPNLQQTCNYVATDCISRQAAIDALCKACEGSGGLCAVFQCADVRAIRNVPPIQSGREGDNDE